MIGDPLYELLRKRRDEKQPQRRPQAPRPEGVTVYQCNGVVSAEDGQDVDTPAIWRQGCGQVFEAKPYLPRPWCHGSPARIVRYDWDRDVT